MSHSTVTLHPQLSRSGAQSNTTETFSTNKALPVPARLSSLPRTTSSSSSVGQPKARQPTHGLSIDASVYPLISDLSGFPPIRVISAADYAEIQTRYANEALPETELFPWSHGGADLKHSPASQYFGFARGTCAKAPSYRGLTTIHVQTKTANGALRRSERKRDGLTSSWSSSSLGSTDSSCESSQSSSASSSVGSSPSPTRTSQAHSLLVSSFAPETILSRSNSGARCQFNLPPPTSFKTVNLRHFGLQAAKFATISDLVLYGEDGLTDELVDAACSAWEAVEGERLQRGKDAVVYNVFVVGEPFSVFERDHSHLVAIDSNGFVRNKLNFLEREREEMRVLTQASEIGDNVFLGNTQDVPLSAQAHGRPLSSDSASSFLSENPLGVAICIEAHEQANNPPPVVLTNTDRQLHELESEARAFEDVTALLHAGVTVDEGSAKSTHRSELNEFDAEHVLRVPVDSICHLECSSTASGLSGTSLTNFVNSTVTLASWIIDQSCPAPTPPGEPLALPRRVLLHCNDGYTETSILALTYVMLSRRCNAPEAYLYLQHQAERSFFVYPADVATLTKIEQRVAQVIKRNDEEREQLRQAQESSPMERSDSGYVEAGEEHPQGPTWAVQAKAERELPALPELKLSTPMAFPWFYGESFEGHFPSRILPFLYLGNLAHANNALMLKELGITHVVSMGESALTPLRPPPFSLTAAFSRQQTLPDNSLWLEERLGNIRVLDQKNVADDGIDSLRPHIDAALEFIEQARREGGRVLVHCRVGVSRSASIVIAYLMRYIELDLASAYLLTRSRRLNILIQPNLPFAATLHAFEADLLKEKDAHRAQLAQRGVGSADEDAEGQLGRAGLKRSNRLGWSTLAHEIAVLNERFLC